MSVSAYYWSYWEEPWAVSVEEPCLLPDTPKGCLFDELNEENWLSDYGDGFGVYRANEV